MFLMLMRIVIFTLPWHFGLAFMLRWRNGHAVVALELCSMLSGVILSVNS